LGVGLFNGVIQIYPRPTLVAMVTKFEDKIGYNSACIRDIADVLASNMVFMPETMNSQITVVSDVSDDTDVFVLLVHYYHTLNFKNYVISAN